MPKVLKMKKAAVFTIIISIITIGTYFWKNTDKNTSSKGKTIFVAENAADIEARYLWNLNRLKDPSGKIPEGIRKEELEFAKNLPNDAERSTGSTWVNRGPFNVGGRTRAMALDVEDENIILAGGVSGGMWRTTNQGQTWTKTTTEDQLHSVTCIAQDKRTGKTNTWYYGTGEIYGNSAGESFTAFYFGDGMYKSIDNGQSWSPIASTVSNTPQLGNDFDMTWNIAVNNAVDTADVIYAALKYKVKRSYDAGETWTEVLGGGAIKSYFTDVAVTSDGVVYATLSYEGDDAGIWRSPDGENWTNIMPSSFCDTYYRIVIGINPSNENEVYFLANTPNCGQGCQAFFDNYEYSSLWKYTYESGNGADTNGTWVNLSSNIPNNGTDFDNFYCQGSYDMVISVHPDNDSIIFIGGTNLYRSTDGFTSQNNTTQIGGYMPGTKLPDWHIYPNHHPDQHVVRFLPSNPNVLFSATDGGVFRTSDCMADSVVWEPLNHGYLTTQVYALSIDENNESDIITAGFQDNGNFFVNSPNPESSWVMPLNGDGSFSAISSDGQTYYMSIQNGKIFKMTLDNVGLPTAFARMDPIGGENYQFINPFAIDPNNDNIMYVADGNKIWRNDSLSYIPLANNYDSISMGWFKMGVAGAYNSVNITAVTVSKNPSDILFYGTSSKKVFRVENASSGDPVHTFINDSTIFPYSNVSCVAVDPRDANKIMITYSNYGTYSLFYTEDGGNWWNKVGGNLEANSFGSGTGPSCRWATIVPDGDGSIFYVATSIGLFYTTTIDGLNTVWTNVSTIGNVVVEMMKYRESDQLIAVGTHGNGVYTSKVLLTSNQKIGNNSNSILLFPNPAKDFLFIDFNKNEIPASITISDITGKLLISVNQNIEKKTKIDISNLPSGIYICNCEINGKNKINKFIVTK